jgi:hypothetical protein
VKKLMVIELIVNRGSIVKVKKDKSPSLGDLGGQ